MGIAAPDVQLHCQLHSHGHALGLPEQTYNMPGSRLRWNEWVTFRAKYCDLSNDAYVTFTLVGCSEPRKTRTLGTARLSLFDSTQQLKTGVVNKIDMVKIEPTLGKPRGSWPAL